MSTVPQVNLSLHQKGVYYMSVKVFKRAPNCKANLVQSKKKFIGKLNSVLLEGTFDSANNFFFTIVECYEKMNVFTPCIGFFGKRNKLN
jgi:hypothetical protein